MRKQFHQKRKGKAAPPKGEKQHRSQNEGGEKAALQTEEGKT